MVCITDDKHVMKHCSSENLFETLDTCSLLIEQIKSGVDDYFDKKRLYFPR